MRIPVLVVLAVIVGGCTTPEHPVPATAHPPAEPLTGAQLARLATGGAASTQRECVDSTIRTSFGIFLMRLGQADDARIGATLTGNAAGTVLKQREAEFRTWVDSHDPYVVGNQHLRWCLEPTLVVPGARIADCLRVAEPSVVMASTRSSNSSRLESMVRIQKLYPGRFTVPELNALADRVYAAKPFPDDLGLQVELFAQCLREDSAT